MNTRKDYSDDFKDLVLSMMSQGEVPSQEEIVREMSKLKKEFIIKEIQR